MAASDRLSALKRAGGRLDDEPSAKRPALTGARDLPTHPQRVDAEWLESQIDELIKARLPSVGSAAIGEIREGIYSDRYPDLALDLARVAHSDLETKLSAVGHHLEGDIAKGVACLVEEGMRNGRDSNSCSGDPDLYRQVVDALPAFSKILRENGQDKDAASADALAIRARRDRQFQPNASTRLSDRERYSCR